MRILGLEANVGSLLYPFQEAGHTIVGNYDSRGLINEENFGLNFPESELYEHINSIMGEKFGVSMQFPSYEAETLNN